MHHQELEPSEELQDTIQGFWYISQDFGERQSSFEVLPDGYAELIFYFGSGCNIAYKDGVQLLPSPFLTGLLEQPVVFYTKNRLEIIGVRCYPWAVFDLLGLPAGKDPVRTFEHPIAQLQPTLNQWLQAGRVAEALAEVNQYFLRARRGITTDSMLVKAGAALSKAGGALPVSQVAEAAHTTVRTLERKFKQAAGYTVKDVSGLMRFEQARDHLWFNPQASIDDLAEELGYTDRSHLSREFKRYSGTTPVAFARQAKKNKLTGSADFVAFIPT